MSAPWRPTARVSPGWRIPGETLKVGIWKEDGRFLASVVAPARDNAVVLSGVELVPV